MALLCLVPLFPPLIGLFNVFIAIEVSMKKTLLVLVVAGAVHSTVFAKNQLEEMIVTSSRTDMPLRTIGTSLSVINAAEIESLGFSTMLDVLRTVPGIAGSNQGGAGKATSLRIRGEEGYRTQAYIDGIKISDPTGTQVGPNFAHILSAGIQRVEVLRGAQGLIYGADGGGVINIFTGMPNTSEESTANITVEAGAYNTKRLNAVGAIESNGLELFANVTRFDTGGFNARPSDLSLDKDGYQNDTQHLKAKYSLNKILAVSGVLRHVEGETQFDGCSGTNDCLSIQDQISSRFNVDINVDNYSSTVAFSRTNTDRENFNAGASGFATDGDLERAEYKGNITFNEQVALLAGYDWEQENVNTSGGDNFKRKQSGVYAEAQINIDDTLYMTAGLRNDKHDLFGSVDTYRASGAYLFELPADNLLKLKASYGTGFRAPSISEQAYNNGSNAFGAAQRLLLSEETSDGWDAGFEYVGKNGVRAELVYFDQTIKDEIFFDLVFFQGYLQAVGDTTTKGLELSADYPFSESFTVSVNYTYNDTETTSGQQRARRPRHIANVTLSLQSLDGKLQTSLHARAARDAENEIFGIGRVDLDDYEVVTLNMRYSISPQFDIFGKVENIFDEEYVEVTDYNTANASAYIGVSLNF